MQSLNVNSTSDIAISGGLLRNRVFAIKADNSRNWNTLPVSVACLL